MRALLVTAAFGVVIVRYVIRQYVRRELTRGTGISSELPESGVFPFTATGSSRAVAAPPSSS